MLASVVADPAFAALLRRNAALSAAINAAASLGFFLLVFGWPTGRLAMGRPDNFALDFLPQAAAVAFMSAWVPVLVSRRDVARFSGQAPRPVQLITLRAGGFALAALVPGGLLAGAALALAWAPLALWPAVAIKLCFGGLFGALVTTLAIRRNAR